MLYILPIIQYVNESVWINSIGGKSKHFVCCLLFGRWMETITLGLLSSDLQLSITRFIPMFFHIYHNNLTLHVMRHCSKSKHIHFWCKKVAWMFKTHNNMQCDHLFWTIWTGPFMDTDWGKARQFYLYNTIHTPW